MALPVTEETVEVIEKREIIQEIISETSPEGTSPEIFQEETSELIEIRQEHNESTLHDSIFSESNASESFDQATEDRLFRGKSDYCLIQARKELIQGDYYIQKRHTNLGDTPYNTDPIIRSESNSFSDSGTVILLSQPSLGSFSACSELAEISELDNVFSIQEEHSQSLSPRDREEYSQSSSSEDREEELDHSHLEEEEGYSDNFPASL
ncbi:hypothetical protein CU098_011978 [Rhizopus stolonifer]|uniref:Uncharacterized protein n=1 Tax=Rhizopus stolonifer TaxID=4846 RepID=A0A367KK95_RHIST|nr:hypothetical protein CU098_011978 [Rhizopus stolonifer]